MKTTKKIKKYPLEGTRVLSFTQSWTGPFGSMLLGDLGAENIRLEQIQYPGATRCSIPFPARELFINQRAGGMHQYPDREPTGPNGEYFLNRFSFGNCHLQNTYSLTLDFSRPKGWDVLEKLIEKSDIFIENNTPTTLPKLGLTWEVLHEINPRLIVIRAPGFGLDGPRSHWKGFGNNVESTIGHAHAMRYSEKPEHTLSNQYTFSMDNCGAHTLPSAAMMGLLQRKKTGKGMLIEVAQAEAVMSVLPIFTMDHFINGRTQPPYASRHPVAVQGCYPSKGDNPDYDWVVITISNDDEWRGFCKAIGNPEWCSDARFGDNLSRRQNQDRLDDYISQWTRQHTNYEVMHLLQKQGVPAGPVMTEKMSFEDPHLKERDFFITETQKWTGTYQYTGYTGKFQKTPRRNRADMPAAGFGEHNEYVLKDLLGISDEAYRQLEEENYIGTELL